MGVEETKNVEQSKEPVVSRRTFLAMLGAAIGALFLDPTEVGEAFSAKEKVALPINYSDEPLAGLSYKVVPWDIEGRDAKFATRIQATMAKTAKLLIDLGISEELVYRKMSEVQIVQTQSTNVSVYSEGKIGISALEANSEDPPVPHEFFHHFFLVGPQDNPDNNVLLSLTEGAAEAFCEQAYGTDQEKVAFMRPNINEDFNWDKYVEAAKSFLAVAKKFAGKSEKTFFAFCVETYAGWEQTDPKHNLHKPMPVGYFLQQIKKQYGNMTGEITHIPIFNLRLEPKV